MAISPVNGTGERILDAAQYIIQTRGYGDLTLNDIADAVGIRKPTIMHYFDSKAALATAVVARYRGRFGTALGQLLESPRTSVRDALTFYCGAYVEFSDTGDKICLCGALAGELHALPSSMQEEVRDFFGDHQRWLEEILAEGIARGEIRLATEPTAFAKFMLSALQGSLLISRVTGDRALVRDAVESLRTAMGLAGVASHSQRV